MENLKEKLEELVEAGNWSANDRSWLLNYLEQNDSTELRQIMQLQFNRNIGEGEAIKTADAIRLLELIKEKLQPAIKPAKLIRFPYRKWAAAAAVLLSVSLTYFLFINKPKKEIAAIDPVHPQPVEILPGGNKATLTLADGTTIILDNAQNGELSLQGGTKVVKLDNGQLAYNKEGNAAEVVYNIVATPRGGQYQLTLADGSKVWLNAASSLRFPASFTGTERRVQLTGEGYFEIAQNVTASGAKQSFIVEMAGKGEVEVLGTHFNINAYADEPAINTTLTEGSVKVLSLSTHAVQTIRPGQQAQLNSNGQLHVNKNADIEEVLAWKNGTFNFNSATIEIIMRQVSRWYDLDVVFAGKISKETFTGFVSRNSNVSQVLKIMEEGGVKFRIEGKRLVVSE